MSILTAIFQAIGQAITWILPVSEEGHSAIFHDLSGRFSGNYSQLTGVIHIGIAIGILIAFYKLFIIMGSNFFGTFGDLFHKRLNTKSVKPSRKFMYMTVIAFLPMLMYLIPVSGFGNFYGVMRYLSYDGTLIEEGICFLGCGFILLFTTTNMNKGSNDRDIPLSTALVLGFIGMLTLPIAGIPYIGILFCLATLMGVTKKYSLRFSIIMTVPVLVVTGIIEICTGVTKVGIIAGILGFVFAVATSFLASKVLLYFINKSNLYPFGYYDVGIGVITFFVGLVQIFVR